MQSSEIWIFAKAFQFLFCLMLLLAMLDAARQPGNFGLVLGVCITYALLIALLRYRMLASGYADVPLAFFAWMPVYALIRAEGAPERREFARWLFVGALMAAGAALTKQIGLYVAAAYPLLAWLASSKNGSHAFPAVVRVRILARLCVLIAALAGPWYFYKLADIRAGHDANNTPQLVADFHEGRVAGERLVYAGHAVLEAVTIPGCVLLGIAVAAAWSDRRSRRLLVLFVAPLGLVWAAGFSYDLRNLAILAPFLGTAAGRGFARIACWIEDRLGREEEKKKDYTKRASRFTVPAVGQIRVGYLFAFVVLASLAAVTSIGNGALLELQRRQQRDHVGIVSLYKQLYSFAESHSREDLIATDYLATRWLPELTARSVVCTCHELSAFRRTFDLPNVRYVLVRTASEAADVRAFLARPGAVQLLFEDHGFAFYEKLTGNAVMRAAAVGRKQLQSAL
jgi:hypothetical protein